MNILICGGLGFIGSIVAKTLKEQNHEVVIFDHCRRHNRQKMPDFEVIAGDVADYNLLKTVLADKKIEAVMHFAAWIEAGESMKNPAKYFDNNVNGSLQLFKAIVDCHIDKLVFSSTAAVYGNPVSLPIKEDAILKPVNAYGESKLIVEKMLDWFDKIHNLRSIKIRYFNAAGALPEGSLGEDHNPETHLIPNLIKSILNQTEFKLFGNDYQTSDGTCVRDYIHVLDLASAHILALDALVNNHPSDIYNAGTGQGYSNKQVLDMVEQVSGQKINLKIESRREGDPEILVADSTKLQQEFNWQPQYSDLKTIVETAWNYYQKNFNI